MTLANGTAVKWNNHAGEQIGTFRETKEVKTTDGETTVTLYIVGNAQFVGAHFDYELTVITCQRCTSPVENDGDTCAECQASIDIDTQWRAERDAAANEAIAKRMNMPNPVNNGAASLKDFDDSRAKSSPIGDETDRIYNAIDELSVIGDKRHEAMADNAKRAWSDYQAKFDTVETLLHEANLELERVKAERDAACKAASNGLSAAYRAFREISNTSGDNRSIDDAKEAIEAIEKTYSVMNALKAKEQSNG